MAKKLNQIVAIEKGEKARIAAEIMEHVNLLSKGQLSNGIQRTFKPFKDAIDTQRPAEATLVQVKASDVIESVTDLVTRLFDVTATKEWANTSAIADVVVNGKAVIEKAPITYLLFLEKELANVASFVKRLPTLDPTEDWHWDENTSTFKTTPVNTLSTKKVMKNHVRAEATDKHPAQVEVFQEDEPVGMWETIKSSGGLKLSEVKAIQNRINDLLLAVKQAREEANGIVAEDKHVGKAVLSYIFGK